MWNLSRLYSSIFIKQELIFQLPHIFSFASVVNDWNRVVVQFTGSWTELLNTDSVLTLLNKQFLLRENSNTNLNVVDSTLSIIGTNNVNQNSVIGNGNKAGVQKIPKLSLNTKNSWNINSSVDSSEIKIENRNYTKDGSTSNSQSDNKNNGNSNNGNGINKNKISSSSDSHDRSGNSKKLISMDSKESIRDEPTWGPIVKNSKNKNAEKSSGSSTTFLNNITKKATKVDNSAKKNSSLTQSAFTSYLQELMDFDE